MRKCGKKGFLEFLKDSSIKISENHVYSRNERIDMFRTKIMGIGDVRGRRNLKSGEVVISATMGEVRPISLQ